MTEEERNTINMFKVAVSLLRTGPDGFPLPGQELELRVIEKKVFEVCQICQGSEDREKSSLWELASATLVLILAVHSDVSDFTTDDASIPERWFRARAELVEPSV